MFMLLQQKADHSVWFSLLLHIIILAVVIFNWRSQTQPLVLENSARNENIIQATTIASSTLLKQTTPVKLPLAPPMPQSINKPKPQQPKPDLKPMIKNTAIPVLPPKAAAKVTVKPKPIPQPLTSSKQLQDEFQQLEHQLMQNNNST